MKNVECIWISYIIEQCHVFLCMIISPCYMYVGEKGVSSFCVGGRVCPHSVFGCLFLSLKIMYNTTLIVVVVTSNGRHLKKKL